MPKKAESTNMLNKQDSKIICYCKNVTEQEITDAIHKGAISVLQVTAATGAGNGGRCKIMHPEKRCCHSDIQNLINKYVMREK